MTELLIDNQSVTLPNEFQLEILSENPFFTKNGQYTYDVTLSLEDTRNTKIYKHYNRLNNADPIASPRTATLIVDNRVLLRGTEIILEITEKQVKIQLVSGESELNYFIGGDRKLNELDLGTLNTDNPAETDTLYCWPVIYSTNEQKTYNDFTLTILDGIWIVVYKHFHHFPQPYLRHILNLIFEKIGYTIESSVFETTNLKYLFIVNGISTIYYNKMLPDWTVTEFCEELEKLFNISFLIDSTKKSVRIEFRSEFYAAAQKQHIHEVLDEFVQTIDRGNTTDYSNANIGYDLPDNDYFNFQDIDNDIDEHVTKTHFTNYAAILSDIEIRPKNQIFVSDASNTEYIRYDGQGVTGGNLTYPKKVNAFKPIINNPESPNIDIELKITPAPMAVRADLANHIQAYLIFTYQAIEVKTGVGAADDGIIDIQEAIEGEQTSETLDEEEEKEELSSDGIQLAFYAGYKTVYQNPINGQPATQHVDLPIAFVDYLWETNQLSKETAIDNFSLRLDDPKGLKPYYASSLAINTTREYTIKFISKEKLDPKAIFVINNKEFACKQLKYSIDENGMDSIIQGVFYPVAG